MVVAEITKDHLFNTTQHSGSKYDPSRVGKQFDSEALRIWWGWADDYTDNYFQLALDVEGKTTFKLYDDDGELYYEGWLINDEECIVQQFVLGWAEEDSGCTIIKVHKAGANEYVQEIG